MSNPSDPDPVVSEDDLKQELIAVAEDKLSDHLLDDDSEFSDGIDLPDDGEPADAVDHEGNRWRVSIEVKLVRQKLVDPRSLGL